MRKLYSIFVFFVLMLSAAVAFAADGDSASPTWLTQITDVVVEILFPIVLLLALWVGRKATKWIEAKLKVDIPDKQEAQIDKWIEFGIHWAEEKSRSAIKKGTDKVSGSDKLDMVVGLVLGFAQSQGWIEWTKERIIARIEGRLGQMRANGGKPDITGDVPKS